VSIKIWPYKQGSRGARALRDAINSVVPNSTRLLLPETGSKWHPRRADQVINWGNGSLDRDSRMSGVHNMLNHPRDVSTWSNKLMAFNHCASVGLQESIPPYTTDREVAQSWLDEESRVIVRHTLHGNSGTGIEVINHGDTLPTAPLYTKYVKRKSEWRIHFIRGAEGTLEYMYQQKRRRKDTPDAQVDWQVRNYKNGFIYAIDEIDVIPDMHLKRVGKLIHTATEGNLDFGAADVVFASKASGGQFILLEINTACGIESPTLAEFYGTQLARRLSR
jgi:hypothetical protein